MRVKYEEGVNALTVPGCGIVPRGEEVEVSAEVGKSLLEQGWVDAGKSKSKKPVVESVDSNKESN